MTPEEFVPFETRLRERLVALLEELTPAEGMNSTDFTNFMQAVMWCAYSQLKENLGAKAGMMAVGELLQIAVQQAGPQAGVRVDVLHMPKKGKMQ